MSAGRGVLEIKEKERKIIIKSWLNFLIWFTDIHTGGHNSRWTRFCLKKNIKNEDADNTVTDLDPSPSSFWRDCFISPLKYTPLYHKLKLSPATGRSEVFEYLGNNRILCSFPSENKWNQQVQSRYQAPISSPSRLARPCHHSHPSYSKKTLLGTHDEF